MYNNAEFVAVQIAERRADFEAAAAIHRLSRRTSVRDRWSRLRRQGRTDAASIDPRSPAVTAETPTPGTVEFGAWAAALGHQLAENGPRPIERQLKSLARLARTSQVAVVSASVLVDRGRTDVVRARAYSRVVTALATLTPGVAEARSIVA